VPLVGNSEVKCGENLVNFTVQLPVLGRLEKERRLFGWC